MQFKEATKALMRGASLTSLARAKVKCQFLVASWELQVQVLNVMFNPYKHSVLFVGHRQTVHTQLRRRRMRCLIRTRRLIKVSTDCLQNVLLEFE